MRLWQSARMIAAGSAAALALSLAAAAPAHAVVVGGGGGGTPPPCFGTACNGLNPQSTGCSTDAVTLDQLTPPGGGGTVELRYSAWCGAAWARSDNYAMNSYVSGWSASSGGYEIIRELTSPTVLYSAMVSYSYWVDVCMQAAYSGYYCTARH